MYMQALTSALLTVAYAGYSAPKYVYAVRETKHTFNVRARKQCT